MGEWKLAPVEPTGDMMDAVRHLFQWLAFARPTEQELLRHCERRRIEPPAECRDVDHVPPKRMMAYWVYKGMLAASPAPSLPEDVERVVEQAKVFIALSKRIGNYSQGFRLIDDELLPLIQSLSSQLAEANERYAREAHAKMVALEQLAEARANFNQVSRTCGEYLDQIDDLKADRGRLAADNKRLREAGQALIAFDDYPVEAKRPDVFAMRRQALRTALAGKAGEA